LRLRAFRHTNEQVDAAFMLEDAGVKQALDFRAGLAGAHPRRDEERILGKALGYIGHDPAISRLIAG
jgi:hypothetical protein